jgi:hypothetical protein
VPPIPPERIAIEAAPATPGGFEQGVLLQKAAERLARLAREEELGYLGYFWLACAQDELGQWYEEVHSNLAARLRRPRYAPAKYNAAVSYVKLERLRHAFARLSRIRPDDEAARGVLESAFKDPELLPRVKERDAESYQAMRELLDRLLRQPP